MLSLTSDGPNTVAQAIVLHAHVATRESVTAAVHHEGRHLADMHVRPGPHGQELRAAIDVGALGPGDHTLALVVHDGERLIARLEREVTVDSERAYRALRAARRSRPPAARDTPGTLSFLVAAVGRAAADPATSIALRVASGAGDTLYRPEPGRASVTGVLHALLRSRHRYALIVEEPGILWRDAAHLLSRAIADHDEPDALYGDDELAETPAGGAPVRLKPAWSPDLLLQTDYTGPVLAIGRAAAQAALNAPQPPADLRDVLLAQEVSAARVVHVPRSLFVRTAPAAARTAPLDTAPAAPAPPSPVSVIICSSGHGGHLERCLRSLLPAAARTPLEVVLVCDATVDGSAGDELVAAGVPVTRIAQGQPFNYSTSCNAGAAIATGDELLFLNDDVIACDDRWLERMRAWLHRPGVGVVGARLRYPDGPIQHRGVVVDPRRIDNLGCGWPSEHRGATAVNDLTRTMSAVTGACQLVRRDIFEAIAGYDPELALEFNDVDLPLRAAERGARTVYTPEADLVHVEGGTRGRTIQPADHQRFLARWADLFADGDPGRHPALHLINEIDPDDEVDPDRLRSREALWAPVSPAARRRLAPDRAIGARVATQAALLSKAEARLHGAAIELRRQQASLEYHARLCAAQHGQIAEQQAQTEQQRELIEAYGRRAAALDQTIGVIRDSRSWQLTAPLRGAAARLRAWRRP